MTDHSLILSGHRGLFSDSASCQLDCEVVSCGIQAKNANSFEISVRFFIETYDTSVFFRFADKYYDSKFFQMVVSEMAISTY